MRSHVDFRSAALTAADAQGEAPRGWAVAQLLAAHLPAHGLAVAKVIAEDWGWLVRIENPTFPLWIGCGHDQDHDDGFLCFVEPSKPFVRRWWKRISTAERVEQVAVAMDRILREEGKIDALHWWSAEEVARG